MQECYLLNTYTLDTVFSCTNLHTILRGDFRFTYNFTSTFSVYTQFHENISHLYTTLYTTFHISRLHEISREHIPFSRLPCSLISSLSSSSSMSKTGCIVIVTSSMSTDGDDTLQQRGTICIDRWTKESKLELNYQLSMWFT